MTWNSEIIYNCSIVSTHKWLITHKYNHSAKSSRKCKILILNELYFPYTVEIILSFSGVTLTKWIDKHPATQLMREKIWEKKVEKICLKSEI